jgi:hypothetical protein
MSARRLAALLSAIVACAVLPGAPLESAPATAPRHRPLSAFDRTVVERVRARAAARLEHPDCDKVLTDFTDGAGRTLESNLQLLGVSPSRYLLELSFLDGSLLPACKSLAVIMAATPGVPRVFVCPAGVGRINSRVLQIELANESLAEAMVIHEMLHTLGLGENPPSTFEITERVRDRCR